MAKVLIVGVYLADRPTWVTDIIKGFAASLQHTIDQRWISLWTSVPGLSEVPHTTLSIRAPAPKFDLLNRVLLDADGYDWVIIADDDVIIPDGWLDKYLDLVERFDFALSQPARTLDSYIDHPIVAQALGLVARRTRFVEIGPVFCIRRDALPLIVPFDVGGGMGWGFDFTWPVRLETAGLRLGIVDAAPIAHTLRKPAQHYARSAACALMDQILSAVPHLNHKEAFTVLEAYAEA